MASANASHANDYNENQPSLNTTNWTSVPYSAVTSGSAGGDNDYIEVNELKDVRFSKLSNTIEIKDEEIHIPKMEIKSSALDIILSGIHGFDNKVNYNFRVYLPELLANKTRKRKKENNEFGHVEDDGLGMWLFLTMKGTIDDLIVRYDKKEAIKKIGEDIKEEKLFMK